MHLIQFWGPNSEWFWVFVQAVGVVTTLLFIYRQIRVSQYTTMLVELSKFVEIWKSKEMKAARKFVCQAYLADTTRASVTLDPHSNAVLKFFENVGLPNYLGVINDEVLWERLSFDISHYWGLLERRVLEAQASDPTLYDKFTRLAARMQKIAHSRCKEPRHKTHDKLITFAKDEIAALDGLGEFPTN